MGLLLKCENCHSEFHVGSDAIIEEMPGDQALRLTMLAASRGPSNDALRKIKEEPHNVKYVNCQTLSAYDKQVLDFTIRMVKEDISSGERRFWRCGRCDRVQHYRL